MKLRKEGKGKRNQRGQEGKIKRRKSKIRHTFLYIYIKKE